MTTVHGVVERARSGQRATRTAWQLDYRQCIQAVWGSGASSPRARD